MPADQKQGTPSRLRAGAVSAGGDARAAARKAVVALVEAVGALADAAVDRVLLSDERVGSAAEARRLLAGEADTEVLADKIQRVVVLAVPVIRIVARGARFTRLPVAMLASSSLSVALTVRAGVRELQLLSSLVAFRLERTGASADPALVKKVAVDLYLHPKRPPDLGDDKLRLVRLTRKWVVGGAFGRNTSKRATRAFASAEKLDGADLAARWDRLQSGGSARANVSGSSA
jgi:hypothetical protein